MHVYLLPIEKEFLNHADPEKARSAKAYLLNQFDAYGIMVPVSRKLSLQYINANPVSTLAETEKIIKAVWQLPQREWQYLGIELLIQYKKEWKISTIELVEYCITHKSWWDTVDYIADAWAGEYFKLFPQQVIPVTGKWNQSENIWLQRTSLLFQKKYKKATDTKLLAKYILHLSSSKEFFIRKAIGWMLREYARTDPDWVKSFVNATLLSPLSKKEALKHL